MQRHVPPRRPGQVQRPCEAQGLDLHGTSRAVHADQVAAVGPLDHHAIGLAAARGTARAGAAAGDDEGVDPLQDVVEVEPGRHPLGRERSGVGAQGPEGDGVVDPGADRIQIIARVGVAPGIDRRDFHAGQRHGSQPDLRDAGDEFRAGRIGIQLHDHVVRCGARPVDGECNVIAAAGTVAVHQDRNRPGAVVNAGVNIGITMKSSSPASPSKT